MTTIYPLPDNIVAERSNALREFLWDLKENYIEDDPENSSELEEYSKKLMEIYADEYRQMYSVLYPILSELYLDHVLNLEIVTENLTVLKTHIGNTYTLGEDGKYHSDKYDDELYGRILKLIDHINLEYRRLSRDVSHASRLEEEEDRIESLEDSLNRTMHKIKSSQVEMVSILAIFAAIVIAFSGGLSIIGSTISGVASADISKTICIASLCGLVLFNTLALLLVTIYGIINSHHTSIRGTLNEIKRMPMVVIYLVSNAILVVVFIWSLSVCL